MTKYKSPHDDVFQRGARLRTQARVDRREVDSEADRAASEDFFQALVSAVAIIAHADGRLDLTERRKLVEAYARSPALEGFSVSDLAEELADHSRAYGYAPELAEQRALASLSTIALSPVERNAIRATCHQVITADGLVHPVELGALHRIERALGIEGIQK